MLYAQNILDVRNRGIKIIAWAPTKTLGSGDPTPKIEEHRS
jgi:hypothetical protein